VAGEALMRSRLARREETSGRHPAASATAAGEAMDLSPARRRAGPPVPPRRDRPVSPARGSRPVGMRPGNRGSPVEPRHAARCPSASG
jgi:hypothetical protein